MSTRWQISAKLSDGRFGCIYVHCDGYPEYALVTLQEHYEEQDKIDQLIALGDCLGVDKELKDCETFLSRGDEWEDVQPSFANSAQEAADAHKHGDEEYRYYWDGKNWGMASFHD